MSNLRSERAGPDFSPGVLICDGAEPVAWIYPQHARRFAALFVASEALLAACEDALKTGEKDMQEVLDNGRLRDVLQAAIDKAKGVASE